MVVAAQARKSRSLLLGYRDDQGTVCILKCGATSLLHH